MTKLGDYDHLNATDPPSVPCSMPELVANIRRMNYGAHRFLSELVRQREASDQWHTSDTYRRNTTALRVLLDSGFY